MALRDGLSFFSVLMVILGGGPEGPVTSSTRLKGGSSVGTIVKLYHIHYGTLTTRTRQRSSDEANLTPIEITIILA